MKYIITAMIASLFLIGCGGGSSSNSSGGGTPPTSNVDMVIGQSYSVYTGNTIVKDTATAKVSIRHIDGQNESIVELLEGSATIVR